MARCGVISTFLSGEYPQSGYGATLRNLHNTTYGTRDAPRICGERAEQDMQTGCLTSNKLHPPAFWDVAWGLSVVVQVDGFLFVGARLELKWVYAERKNTNGPKQNFVGQDVECEVGPGNHEGAHETEWEYDPKRVQNRRTEHRFPPKGRTAWSISCRVCQAIGDRTQGGR